MGVKLGARTQGPLASMRPAAAPRDYAFPLLLTSPSGAPRDASLSARMRRNRSRWRSRRRACRAASSRSRRLPFWREPFPPDQQTAFVFHKGRSSGQLASRPTARAASSAAATGKLGKWRGRRACHCRFLELRESYHAAVLIWALSTGVVRRLVAVRPVGPTGGRGRRLGSTARGASVVSGTGEGAPSWRRSGAQPRCGRSGASCARARRFPRRRPGRLSDLPSVLGRSGEVLGELEFR